MTISHAGYDLIRNRIMKLFLLAICVVLIVSCAKQSCEDLIAQHEKKWEGKNLKEPLWKALPKRCLKTDH